MTAIIHLAGRPVGAGAPCFVIAEIGVNHNGDLAVAQGLVEVAAAAGADAVKFQTFTAEMVATASAPKARYQQETTGSDGSQLEMLRGLELSPEAHRALVEQCRRLDVLFLSTPYDAGSAAFLAELGVPAFKVPSGEITNHPFLARLAGYAKPLLVSTGMAFLEEVEAAVNVIRGAGGSQIGLLHCVSAYPAPPAEANLLCIPTMAQHFSVPVGFSDYTTGTHVALAAVAIGAAMLEKHFTLDRTLPGPDQRVSLEPPEFAAMVDGIRTVEAATGSGIKAPSASELENRRLVRRSLAVSMDVPEGTRLTEGMLCALRPAQGITPTEWHRVLGRITRRPMRRHELLTWDDLT